MTVTASGPGGGVGYRVREALLVVLGVVSAAALAFIVTFARSMRREATRTARVDAAPSISAPSISAPS